MALELELPAEFFRSPFAPQRCLFSGAREGVSLRRIPIQLDRRALNRQPPDLFDGQIPQVPPPQLPLTQNAVTGWWAVQIVWWVVVFATILLAAESAAGLPTFGHHSTGMHWVPAGWLYALALPLLAAIEGWRIFGMVRVRFDPLAHRVHVRFPAHRADVQVEYATALRTYQAAQRNGSDPK
ncbi:MAG: hypothetical protein ACREJ2_18865 [Planctomycetota bacterium]